MMNENIEMSPNPLVQYLNKPANEFTKFDLIKYIEDHNIEMVNFRYVGWDERLKTLNFVINSKRHLDNILTAGERVDGSNLFSFIEAQSSDLYVIPRYKTAFLNPFSEIPSLDILCSYYNKDGQPFKNSPEYILKKSHQVLKKTCGLSFEAMGELEYYIIQEKDPLFAAEDQKGYQESFPFIKSENLRLEAMHAIARTGGNIKYGHSEVGNFNINNLVYEQNEIEFTPTKVEEAADQLIIAKWILRTLAYKYGVTITFAPKITTAKVGSGLHIHTKLIKDSKNALIENGELSNIAKKIIAGYLYLSPSLTAFGNINPTSYFRLVPNQEAPTNICWGKRNRSALVRVPLGWTGTNDMAKDANPLEIGTNTIKDFSQKQTIEFRSPDGSADIYLLLAGLIVAARHGFEMKNSLEFAEKTYVDVNIFEDKYKDKIKKLAKLPTSCWQSAACLENQREIYQKYDVFPQSLINGIIKYLKNFNDKTLIQNIKDNDEEVMKLVNTFFNCG